jgi:DNA-binding transcriptional ArsR family regulator
MAKVQLQIEKLEMASSKLRAMAHPMRIAILELLQYDNKMSVTEIYRKLKIEQAAASHHLNILKNKGILQSQRDGKKIFYTLKSSVLSEILDCLNRCTDE